MVPRPTRSPLQQPSQSLIAPAHFLCQCILPPQWLALPGTSSLSTTHNFITLLRLTFSLYSSSSSTWSEWDGWSSYSSSSSSSYKAAAVYTSSSTWVGWTSTPTTTSYSTAKAAVSTYAPAAYNATTPAYAAFTGAANQVVAQAGAGLAAIAGVAAYLL
jgi:hypothetical protein